MTGKQLARVCLLGAMAAATAFDMVGKGLVDAPASAPMADVAHLLGLPDVGRRVKGTLSVRPDAIEFKSEKATARIEPRRIKSFYMEKDTRALIGGTAGKLVILAPFGSGRAISMIRPSIDVLTLLFVEPSGGLHAAVLFLPKGQGEPATAQLKAAGIAEGVAIPAPPPPGTPAPKSSEKLDPALAGQFKHSTVVAEPVTFLEKGIPASYQAAIYEGSIERLRKSNHFQKVVRSGDDAAARDPQVLHMQTFIEQFKVGNPRMRSLTFFGGATDIKARIRLVKGDDKPVLDRQIEGRVSHFGENIEASDSLSKSVDRIFVTKPASTTPAK